MEDNVRTFVAIEFHGHVRSALVKLVGQLARARVDGLRPVNPLETHLTLKFLGNLPSARLESMASEIRRAVSGQHSFTIALNGAGVFPKKDEPRVLWVGIDGDLSALSALHKAVEDALEKLGFSRERREFSPHLTVARIRNGTPADDRWRAREALFSATTFDQVIRIDVDHISLMQSILLPEGATYLRLARITLTDPDAQIAAN